MDIASQAKLNTLISQHREFILTQFFYCCCPKIIVMQVILKSYGLTSDPTLNNNYTAK